MPRIAVVSDVIFPLSRISSVFFFKSKYGNDVFYYTIKTKILQGRGDLAGFGRANREGLLFGTGRGILPLDRLEVGRVVTLG